MSVNLLQGDCTEILKTLPDNSVDCIVTSPPYNKLGLRGGKSGGEDRNWVGDIRYNTYDDNMSEEDYQQWQINLLNECWRVLKPTGSMFYNHKVRRNNGQGYFPTWVFNAKLKFYQLIVWDRGGTYNMEKTFLYPTTELIFWLTKETPKTYKDALSLDFQKEVWRINPIPCDYHPAPFPYKLAENCIKLSTKEGDTVLDPFLGSGTSGIAAKQLSRNFIGIELDEKYLEIAKERIENDGYYVNYEKAEEKNSNSLF